MKMPWVIDKPGWVLLQKNEEPLESFDVIAFDASRSYAPECQLAEDLGARLRGRKGYFDISGQVSHGLLAAVEEGETLTVCCEYRGGTLKADVKIIGGPVRLGGATARFHFLIDQYIGFCMPPSE